MYAPRFLPASLSLLASGLVAAFAGTAHAGQSCALDSDCGHGFACQVVAELGCGDNFCPEGAACPAPPPCENTQIKECVPGPCTAHSDCAEGMVCIGSTAITSCPTEPAPACPPNADCVVPPTPPSDCTTVTVTKCTPLYELPCANEASCGAGFNCVPDPDACGCSGSSGTGTAPSGSSSGSAGAPNTGTPTPAPGTPTPPSDPGGAKPPPSDPGANPPPTPLPPPDCTCTPSTTKHCEPKAVSCILDSDCPATWTCATVGGTSSGCAGAARILPDGGIQEIPPVCDPAPPTTTIKQCVPPYYGSGFGKAGSSVNEAGSGTTGNGSIPPRGADPIDVGGNPSVPPSSSSGGETGGHITAPAADPGNGTSSDNGSCQMSVGHASTTGASLLALLGIAGMARRRRTRWG